MSEPKISVIVPVYKVEPYIRKCVDSIINQTYTNLEIILVDDGSPDNCPAICDEYAKKDSRVKVIHKENGGLSSARNAGLDVCTGEYIGFVDSDDWIAATMYETLLKSCRTYDSDISVCSCYDWYSEEERKQTEITCKEPVISGQKLVDAILFNTRGEVEPGICGVVVWNKLYKKCCFSGLRFEETQKYGEDFWTFIRMALRGVRCSLCKEPLYYYRIRNSGVMGSTDYIYRSKLAFELADKLCTMTYELGKYIQSAVEHYVVTSFIYINYSAAYMSYNDYKCVANELKRKKNTVLAFYSRFGKKYKVGYQIVIHFPKLFWVISVIRNKKIKPF